MKFCHIDLGKTEVEPKHDLGKTQAYPLMNPGVTLDEPRRDLELPMDCPWIAHGENKFDSMGTFIESI